MAKSSEFKEWVLIYCLLVKCQNMLLIFQKFTSNWSRLTEHWSGTPLEPIRSLPAIFRRSSYLDASSLVHRAVAPLSCWVASTGGRGGETVHLSCITGILFPSFYLYGRVTIFGFNLSFVQLWVFPCFSLGPTGEVWGPTSSLLFELPCYDSQSTVLYCCHCHCQGTGVR